VTGRDRRALMLGGVGLLLAIALKAAPPVVGAVRGLNAEVLSRSKTVARMRTNVRGAGAVFDSATLVRKDLAALAPRLLSGRSSAEATADLISRLTAAAAGSATLEHADPAEDSTRVVWIRRVTVRAAFESDMRGALTLLHAIARQPAVLTVRAIRIVAPDPGSADAAPEILKIETTVSGWYITTPGARQ
jgi:hypothetical protein